MKNIEKPKKEKYLTNKSLLEEIKKSHELGKMTEEFGKMAMILSFRYSQKSHFINYSYNNDMQSYALATICKVWRGFDPIKGQNPFAYFTETIKNAFRQTLNNEKKHRNIKNALVLENGDNPSFSYLDDENNYNEYVSDLHSSDVEEVEIDHNDDSNKSTKENKNLYVMQDMLKIDPPSGYNGEWYSYKIIRDQDLIEGKINKNYDDALSYINKLVENMNIRIFNPLKRNI